VRNKYSLDYSCALDSGNNYKGEKIQCYFWQEVISNENCKRKGLNMFVLGAAIIDVDISVIVLIVTTCGVVSKAPLIPVGADNRVNLSLQTGATWTPYILYKHPTDLGKQRF
jgi:hypothetical protein